jgi:hypothetical protein
MLKTACFRSTEGVSSFAQPWWARKTGKWLRDALFKLA